MQVFSGFPTPFIIFSPQQWGNIEFNLFIICLEKLVFHSFLKSPKGVTLFNKILPGSPSRNEAYCTKLLFIEVSFVVIHLGNTGDWSNFPFILYRTAAINSKTNKVRFVYCLSHSLCNPVPVVVIKLDSLSLVSLRLLKFRNNFGTLSVKNHWNGNTVHVPHTQSPHLRREYTSSKLFCIGVPVTAHLAPALSLHTAMEVWTFGFLILWASSSMTRAHSTLSRGEQGDDPLCKKKQTIYNPEQLPRQALWRATGKYFFQKEAFSFH